MDLRWIGKTESLENQEGVLDELPDHSEDTLAEDAEIGQDRDFDGPMSEDALEQTQKPLKRWS